MNFSNQWHSLWSVAAVPHTPNLLSRDQVAALGPLFFHPSPQHHILHASSSLALCILSSSLSPPTILDNIQSFFRCPSNDSFLPTADLYNLAADIQSSLASAASNNLDVLSWNNLHALPCHDGFSLLLFFQTGNNADEIGFLYLRFRDEQLKPEVGVDLGGDIFKQREGLMHHCHRIIKLSVIPYQVGFSSPTSDSTTEGFLIAMTLYSVSWFKVESKSTDDGILRPFLIPLAKQEFSSCVIDACWSPHLSEESVVLLEAGELCWFNIVSKKGGTLKIILGDGVVPGRWLGCKFGGQPWVVLVASSITIVLIDLRPTRINQLPKLLAKVKLTDSFGVVSTEEKDTFEAFCRADFNDFHFTAVTERLLLLFDIRQPLVPILTWDHGLENPTFVSMFRLSELRPSEEFKGASECGFVILVGSFRKNDFRFFCYGSYNKGAFESSSYAWELSSTLLLSGKQSCFADTFVREVVSREKHPNQEMLRNEGVAGFYIVQPNILLKCRPKSGSFVLIRLMLSGKLEIQEYYSSCDPQNEIPTFQGDPQAVENFIFYSTHEGTTVSSRFHFLKLFYLSKFLNRSLSNILIKRYLELKDKCSKHKSFCDDMREFLSNKLQYSSISISSFIADVSIPLNVFEVAARRVLTTLQPEFLSLAFSKYEELFIGHVETTFLPLKFPKCLPHHRFPPFFVNIPTMRSEIMPRKIFNEDAIAGPILPLPVLLALQHKCLGSAKFSYEEELDGDLFILECKGVLESMFPRSFIADSYDFSELGISLELQDDKQFFMYQPILRDCGSIFNETNNTFPNEKAQSQVDHLLESYLVAKDTPNDENFTMFICGNFDKNCHLDCGSEVTNLGSFDVSPVKLDFELLNVMLQPNEQNFLTSLRRQASKWLESNKSYQDFCSSSQIAKPNL